MTFFEVGAPDVSREEKKGGALSKRLDDESEVRIKEAQFHYGFV